MQPRHWVSLTICALTVIALGGCASNLLTLREPPSGPWRGTGLLLNYDFATHDPGITEGGCTLVLHRAGTKEDASIQLSGTRHHILVNAPAGRYQWKTLTCPRFTHWDLSAMANDAFTAVSGRINYLGRFVFDFGPKGGSMRVRRTGAASGTLALAIDLHSLPVDWQNALENPYTAKPITPIMLAPKGVYRMTLHFVRTVKKGQRPPSVKRLETSLKSCDRQEQERFPYRIGSMTYMARYSDGKLQQLTHRGQNSFSDEFLGCIERSFKQFKPDSSAQLKVTLAI